MRSSPYFATPTLKLKLLGKLEVEVDGQLLTSKLLAKAQALLAYLALTQQPQPRTNLMVLLWGDSSEDAARMSLRALLTNLRTQVAPFLLIERQTVALRPDANISIDTIAFEQQLTYALTQQSVTGLEAALSLYRGELLSGFSVRNAPDFERWLYGEQERQRLLAIRGLEALAAIKAHAGDIEEALVQLRRVLALEPCREETHRQLMALLMLAGHRSAALAQYATCAQMLGEELGVEPSSETTALYQQIQQNLLKMEESPPQVPDLGFLPVVEPTTTLIGRHSEWTRLQQAWQRASQGQAQLVVIAGEAGIGKTRLAEEMVPWVRRQGGRVAVAHCYAAEGELAFTPIVELLRSETVFRTLTEMNEVWLAQVARLLPELLSLHPQLSVTEPSGDPLQRQHFFEALARAILAGQRPLLLIIDDLQWADRETLDWLRYLLRFAPQARLMLLVTVRSEEVMAEHLLQPLLLHLRRSQQLVEIQLGRLGTGETGALASLLLGEELPTEEVAALYLQTEGNPLFVVETVHAELESSGAVSGHKAPFTHATHPVPEGISAIIKARLAQLSPLAQEVAQLAAAVGRAFSLELLALAGNYPEEELLQSLDELWQRHILQDLSGNGYDFSHARIRDVSYSQISPLRRRLLHRRIAQALEQLHPNEIDAASGVIAAHHEMGDQPAQAIDYYRRASHFANQAYAHQEAVEMLRKALVLIPALHDAKERSRQEFEIQTLLGHALMMAKSWTDPEAQQAYSRALELSSDVDVYEALWGLHEIYLMQGNYEKARQASEHCWLLAQRLGNPELLLQAHHAFWALYFWFPTGPESLQLALDHAQAGSKLYVPAWHRHHVLHYGGHDPGVCALDIMAKLQWLLGYPDQALQSMHQMMTLAKQLGHSVTLDIALTTAAKLHCYRREPRRALDFLDESHRTAVQNGLVVGGAHLVLRGWAEGQSILPSDAATLMRQGISNWRAKGMRLEQPFMLALIAETYERSGQIDAAQHAVEEALVLAQATGERYWQPELYRLRGQLKLANGDVDAAQTSFQHAVTLAKGQQAKSLELRAATDLGQLWVERGRRGEAYDLLHPIYAWFTEGFDTADLRRAQELLRELAP